MSDTPETDAETMQDEWDHADTDFGPFEPSTMVSADFARRLERERDEAREELHKASVEANALATSIQKAEYSDAKEFELLGSVAGVISQIDNMYAGVRQQLDEARHEIEGWKNKWNIAVEMAARAENERDEAQYKLADARQSLEVAMEDLSEAKRERDELIDRNAKLRDIADRALMLNQSQ
jgi:chromosome segregation ATPase